MTDEQSLQCHSIIHPTALMAGGIGAGLSQVPCSDSALIIPLQIAIIVSLAGVFSMDINSGVAAATLSTSTATVMGRGVSQILCGWVPVIGNLVNGITASAMTESIGWVTARSFDVKAQARDQKRKKAKGD